MGRKYSRKHSEPEEKLLKLPQQQVTNAAIFISLIYPLTLQHFYSSIVEQWNKLGACRYEKNAKWAFPSVKCTQRYSPSKWLKSNVTETFLTIHVALNV